MLRIPHCVDNGLTDGGKFVSPRNRPHFTPKKHYFYVFGTHFCYRLSKPQDLVHPEGLGKLKKSLHWVSNPRPSGSGVIKCGYGCRKGTVAIILAERARDILAYKRRAEDITLIHTHKQ
jgi:hypothetical protein